MFIQVDVPGVSTFFYEDYGEVPPVPGIVLGRGTYMWEETNGTPGIQRGGRTGYLEPVGVDVQPYSCLEAQPPWDKRWL